MSSMPLQFQRRNAGFHAMLAKGRLKPGEMNASEREYAQHLEALKADGRVLWYAFEGITLKLGRGVRITPDFAVLPHSGVLELHDVKGLWRDDAKAKMRMAAQLFPIRIVAVKKRLKRDGGGWSVEDFSE